MSKTGDGIKAKNSSWSFKGKKVVKKFDNHISRSIPFMKEGHELVSQVSDFFLHNNSTCYEIGCSTGTLINKIAQRHKNKDRIKFIGLDIEKDMINFAKRHSKKTKNIKFLSKDVLNFKFKKCDLIISYYTTQFIKPRDRQKLFNKVYKALNWGGAFIVFEKVRANDARFQDISTGLYNEFKLQNNYSPTEIFNKTRSLKGVLEPFSINGNCQMLERAGFVDYLEIFKYICFSGFLAIK